MRELAVVYRIYPKLGRDACVPPGWDKLALARRCLESFLVGLQDVDYHLTVLLDRCPQAYCDMLTERVPDARLSVISLDSRQGGNNQTFLKQLDILCRQNDAEAVALAEDDYLYHPGAYRAMLDFLNHGDADFVSGYDHPDYYLTTHEPGKQEFLVGLHDYPSFIRWHGPRHWRTVSSTTCSFLTAVDTLRQTAPVFRLYDRIGDYGMWLALTHVRRCHANWRETLNLLTRVPLTRTLGRSYRLFSPMPALACHMVEGCLSPGYDWRDHLKRIDSP